MSSHGCAAPTRTCQRSAAPSCTPCNWPDEDLRKWCASLSDAALNARPAGIAPVAFHIRHIARSVDRLLTYAEGRNLNESQLAALRSELDPGAQARRTVCRVSRRTHRWRNQSPSAGNQEFKFRRAANGRKETTANNRRRPTRPRRRSHATARRPSHHHGENRRGQQSIIAAISSRRLVRLTTRSRTPASYKARSPAPPP